MRRFNLISAAFFFATIATPLSTASATWTGVAGNLIWNDNGNWTAAFPNGAADDATLNAAAATGALIDVTGAIDLNSISNDTNVDLSGAAISFNNAGTKITSTGDLTIGNAVALPTAAVTVSVSLGDTVTFSADVSGTPTSLTLTNQGTVRFEAAATTFTGGLVFDSDITVAFVQGDFAATTVSGSGIFIFNNVTTTFAGDISGNVAVSKVGTGNVTLTGTNTYTRGTTITAGTLTGSPSTIRGDISNSGTLVFDVNDTQFFGQVLSGTGNFVKQGTGTIIFSGANNYTGTTTIDEGILIVDVTTLPSGDVSNSGTLRFTQDTDGTFSGNISGTGVLEKTLSGNLTLSGTNTYTGITTISTGTLTGTTSSIPSGSNITNGAALVFNQSIDGTYSGVISSTGTLTKSGTGIVTLSNTNLYTGDTTVSGGTLSVTGAIANGSTTTVNSGATLRGTGSVGPVTNAAGGTVQAGILAGDTLTINGAYSQTATSTMKSLITTAVASDLTITGTATLAGTLELDVSPGVYPQGTSYTVLTAGSITDNFTTLTEVHEGAWQFSKVGNTIVVSLPSSAAVVTPVPLSELKGNDRVMGDYMFLDPNFAASNSDLTLISNTMLSQGAEIFKGTLIRVSPLAMASLPQTQLQSDVQMAVVLDKQFQKKVKAKRKNKDRGKKIYKEVPCYGMPHTGFFIEPIGVFYHQREAGGTLTNTGQIAFDSYTYGAGVGWEQVLDDMFVVEGGLGYTHSNLHWHRDFGNSRWSTIYVAPFFGWFNARFYANFMFMGALNFFKTDRRVLVPPIERNATSRYRSYDLLLRLNTGARIPFGNINWFQPDATLNYLTVFTEGYTEKGASSISLQVKRRTSYIMQPSFRAKWIQEFQTKKFCYSPILYVGWLANILLQSDNVSARFKDAPNQIFFTIAGYRGTTHQLILGAEFFAQRFEKFEITGTFEVDMLSKFEIYTGKIKFEWLF